jgi:hypothetical protein
VQAIKPNDRPQRQQFAIEMLDRIDQNPNYLSNVMFSDEATFNTCGKVNCHNIRIWDQKTHAVFGNTSETAKRSMFGVG